MVEEVIEESEISRETPSAVRSSKSSEKKKKLLSKASSSRKKGDVCSGEAD